MDELEAFEKRVKAKREAKLLTEQANDDDSTNTDLNTNFPKDANTNIENTNATTATNNTAAAEEANVDELDEYLKNLKLREQQQQDENEAKKAENSVNTSSSAPMNFALLLYWFLAILNLASATFVCKHCSFGF